MTCRTSAHKIARRIDHPNGHTSGRAIGHRTDHRNGHSLIDHRTDHRNDHSLTDHRTDRWNDHSLTDHRTDRSSGRRLGQGTDHRMVRAVAVRIPCRRPDHRMLFGIVGGHRIGCGDGWIRRQRWWPPAGCSDARSASWSSRSENGRRWWTNPGPLRPPTTDHLRSETGHLRPIPGCPRAETDHLRAIPGHLRSETGHLRPILGCLRAEIEGRY